MELDCDIGGGWPAPDRMAQLAEKAGEAVCAVAPELANERLSASVLFTSDEEIHTLNREWRERDKPTNVLSFPMLSRDEVLDLAPEGPPVLLGDIALAHGVCTREAEAKGIALETHGAHLIIHGLLHLAGHDHVHSDEEAEAMETLEIEALAKMGISDPYGDRDQQGMITEGPKGA